MPMLNVEWNAEHDVENWKPSKVDLFCHGLDFFQSAKVVYQSARKQRLARRRSGSISVGYHFDEPKRERSAMLCLLADLSDNIKLRQPPVCRFFYGGRCKLIFVPRRASQNPRSLTHRYD
jgi:hypothetical protein